MTYGRCPNCGQWANGEHECPDFIKHSPTPDTERDNDVRWDEKDDGATASLKAKRILTLDDLIEAAEIDLTKWLIERHVVNKWEVGAKNDAGEIVVEPLFQIKAWLKPVQRFQTIIEEIVDAKAAMEAASPQFNAYIIRNDDGDGVMAEISVPDHHFGMHAWGDETRSDNFDIKIAADTYKSAVRTLVSRTGISKVGSYLFVIGNDGIHADQPVVGSNAGGSTARGTVQDMDTRLQKVFRTKRDSIIWAAQYMAEMKPVNIIVISGNHDYYTSFFLGEVIAAWFRDHPNITVDNTAPQRKYWRHGNVLLGFTHGDKEKPDTLPLLMAQEAKELWADTVYREWHLGHLHKKMGGLTQDSDEFHGVRVRWMPSLTPRDAWHASKGYIHQRSAESLLWHRAEGLVGSAVVNMGIG